MSAEARGLRAARSVRPRKTIGEARRRRATAARSLIIALATLLAGPGLAQSVDVRFALSRGPAVTVEDFGPGQSYRGTLRELTRIMEHLGALYLKPGDRLDLTVLGLETAGIQPFGYGVIGGPRIVTGATPPFIRLAYALHRGGRVVARGVDNVTDPYFLQTQNPRYSAGPLYYEKRILTGWFEDRFRFGRGLSVAPP